MIKNVVHPSFFDK